MLNKSRPKGPVRGERAGHEPSELVLDNIVLILQNYDCFILVEPHEVEGRQNETIFF